MRHKLQRQRCIAEQEEEEEDEFLRYYKKFRPPSSLSYSSFSSRPALSSHASSASPNFSQMSSHSFGLNPRRQASMNGARGDNSSNSSSSSRRRPWYHPKRRFPFLGKSNSEESYEEEDEDVSSRASSVNTSTSPLQGLTGMLSDKMSFNPRGAVRHQQPRHHNHLAHQIHGLEDSQSRDSGNSSGGSPDLRLLRQRRSAPPFPAPSSFETEWYKQPRGMNHHPPLSERASSYYDDRQSVYSYETARDMVDPADIILETAGRRDDVSSVYSYETGRSSRYYDTEPPRRLEAWCPDNVIHKRKRDLMLEDTNLPPMSRSPLKKRPYVPPSHVRANDSDKPATKMSVCLSRLCLVIQTLLMTFSCCLILLAVFFFWRTYKCDNFRQMKLDVESLTSTLKSQLFGQHIAQQVLSSRLREFASSPSVVVLVLTGWLGGGKTFTSSLIRSSFPIPENVHSFSVPLHFAKDTENFHFLDDLAVHITRACGYSLVVFDDVDGGSPKAQEHIGRFVKTLSRQMEAAVSPPISNGTLVLITSNAGGRVINQHVLDTIKAGGSRDQLSQENMLNVLSEHEVEIPCVASFQGLSGVSSSVIPFLPLTRDHVKQCISREAREQGLSASNKEVDRILEEVGFFSKDFPILSKTGCKQIATKVDLILGGQDPYLMLG